MAKKNKQRTIGSPNANYINQHDHARKLAVEQETIKEMQKVLDKLKPPTFSALVFIPNIQGFQIHEVKSTDIEKLKTFIGLLRPNKNKEDGNTKPD